MKLTNNSQGWVRWPLPYCIGLLAWLLPTVGLAQTPADMARFRKAQQQQQPPATVTVVPVRRKPLRIVQPVEPPKPKNWRDKYQTVDYFYEGLAYVKRDGKFGYVNKVGLEVIECMFDDAWNFNSGLGRVLKNGLYGYVDKIGEQAIPIIFQDAGDFSNKIAVVKRANKWGIIDTKGKAVIPLNYDDISRKGEEVFKLGMNGKTIHMSLSGRVFTGNVSSFHNGLAWADQDGDGIYGYINGKGETVIPERYDIVLRFAANKALVSLEHDALWRFIDTQGNPVETARYYDEYENKGNPIRVRRGKVWGYLNTSTWNEVIPCQFDQASNFNNNRASVIKNGQSFFINSDGKRLPD